jgi:hypothetical protein
MSWKNSKFVQNLKRQAEENPVVVLAISAAVITATAKLMEANTQRSYARTHAREVERRMYKTYAPK